MRQIVVINSYYLFCFFCFFCSEFFLREDPPWLNTEHPFLIITRENNKPIQITVQGLRGLEGTLTCQTSSIGSVIPSRNSDLKAHRYTTTWRQFRWVCKSKYVLRKVVDYNMMFVGTFAITLPTKQKTVLLLFTRIKISFLIFLNLLQRFAF